MNDKIVTMALMLTFIMIGINAFLYMASTNFYDQEGNQLNIYYGMDSGGFGQTIKNKAEGTTIDSGTIFNSVPTTSFQQGLIVAKSNNNPVGIDYVSEFYKLGVGVQLVMAKLGELFPIISPILNAFIFFAFAIQGFVIAYFFSIGIRGILGRIV